MSILILGQTHCPICNKMINEAENYYMFPPFVINILDDLYFFNDETFHENCLLNFQGGAKAVNYAEEYISNTRPWNRKCVVDGQLIEHEADDIFVEYLTSKEGSNLHEFNFIHINQRNLASWQKRRYFLSELIKLNDSNIWQEIPGSRYLEDLIESLSRNR